MLITFRHDYRKFRAGQTVEVDDKLAERCFKIHAAVPAGAAPKAAPVVESAVAEPEAETADAPASYPRGRKASRPKPVESDESAE